MSWPSVSLGIHAGHDASAAICTPDGIVAAVAEERLTRVKHYFGFPRLAIESVLKTASLEPADVDLVSFSREKALFPEHVRYRSFGVDGRMLAERKPDSRDRLASVWRVPSLPAQEVARRRKRIASWGEFSNRHYYRFTDWLPDLGLFREGVEHDYFSHHLCHASSAFWSSGLEEAAVLTLDGQGDGVCGAIYRGARRQGLELVKASSAERSLGSFYQAVTEAIGFVPVDGEYKTMGLAATVQPDFARNPFAGILGVESGELKSALAWKLRSYNAAHPERRVPNPLGSVAQTVEFARLLERFSAAELAHYAQDVCEGVMLEFVRDAIALTGRDRLATAGGVMLNVKANFRIQAELTPQSYFVFPDSGDSGLSIGAVFEALHRSGASIRANPLAHLYLGPGAERAEVVRAIEAYRARHALTVEDAGEGVFARAAELLAEGRIIGFFQGRMETGPRALGHRSVLADPRDVKVKERINRLLKDRDWFVPLAPILLEEDAYLYLDGVRDFRFMTFACQATAYAREKAPAVVHLDGTLRPQVVNEALNPEATAVLRAFKQRSGIGLLINTSFNRHGHPIVASPTDALEHLVNGWVETLVIDRFIVAGGGQS